MAGPLTTLTALARRRPTVSPGGEDGPSRLGVMDIGSNSVRLVVFDRRCRAPTVLFNEKSLCGLGATLRETGRLDPEGRIRALRALDRYAAVAARMGVAEVAAIGTAALRDATDGAAFAEEAKQRTGLSIAIASGADEARLAAQGVLLGDPRATGVVADLGGASLELARLSPPNERDDGPAARVGAGATAPVGPLWVRGMAETLSRKRLTERVDEEIAKAAEAALGPDPAAAIGDGALWILGGSWRALAKAEMRRREYPLRVLHGFALDLDAAIDMADWGAAQDPSAYKESVGVSESRASVTPHAAFALSRLLRALRPRRVSLSAFGLREGVLWERLSPEARQVDPLLDACRQVEREAGRNPGFGAELWAFLEPQMAPVLAATPGLSPRLGEAACLLADAVWRAHPDYRGTASFELVTRNTLGAIDHPGRVFIGAALLYRFKNARRALRAEPALALAPEATQLPAEALGRGMRLGTELAAGLPGVLPEAALGRAPTGALSLSLGGAAAALSGDEIEKRLDVFSDALGRAEAGHVPLT